MRQYYETEEDLLLEREEARIIENMTGQNLYKLPIKYGADYLGMKMDSICSMYEIKCRNIPRHKYKTYMISLWKFFNAMSFAKALNVPFVLHVRWNDPVERGQILCTREMLSFCGIQKNNYRNDSGDIEPCLYIPIDKFTMI